MATLQLQQVYEETAFLLYHSSLSRAEVFSMTTSQRKLWVYFIQKEVQEFYKFWKGLLLGKTE